MSPAGSSTKKAKRFKSMIMIGGGGAGSSSENQIASMQQQIALLQSTFTS
jgi:succinate dehydrogenase/fumarate reductase flavoprotein subunit